MAIQLNTLQVGYVSTCRLLNGSGLMGWWTIIPLTYYSHSTEYIASGICVHLQIINIAIQLNTLQVGYVSTNLLAIQLNTLQVGYVSTCRLLT